jgi:hypothetical protein
MSLPELQVVPAPRSIDDWLERRHCGCAMCRPTPTRASLDRADGWAIIDESGRRWPSGRAQISKEMWTLRDVSILRSYARVTPRSALTARNALVDWIISANSALIQYWRRRNASEIPMHWAVGLKRSQLLLDSHHGKR